MKSKPDLKKVRRSKTKLDEFHWHEALDRSLLAFEFFEERVREHPAVEQTPQLARDAKEISERLFRLYQTLGALSVDGPSSRAKQSRKR